MPTQTEGLAREIINRATRMENDAQKQYLTITGWRVSADVMDALMASDGTYFMGTQLPDSVNWFLGHPIVMDESYQENVIIPELA